MSHFDTFLAGKGKDELKGEVETKEEAEMKEKLVGKETVITKEVTYVTEYDSGVSHQAKVLLLLLNAAGTAHRQKKGR